MSSDHRLHPYSILFAFLGQIRVFILPGIFVYFGVGSRDNDWWQPWMMVFILPSAAVAVVRYLTYRYRYEASELVIQTGLLFRKERHIPYARIQNIDAEQNVLHRLLGVVEITIETGSGRAAEATMSVLPLDALSEMRQRVFAERHAVATETGGTVADGGGPLDTHAASATPAPLLQLDVKELLLCGFIENRGAVLIAAGFGLAWETGLADRFVAPLFGETEIGRGVLRDLTRGMMSNASLLWSRLGWTLAAFAGLLLVIRLLSMAWAVIRLYGFRLTLVDGDARSEFGLLTRIATTIPLRRVQALIVREGPLHRLFSRVAVKVNTAGGHGSEQDQSSEREYVAPILPAAARDAFVQALIGVGGMSGLEWRPVSPRAFRREVKGWLAPVVIVCLALGFYAGWAALAVTPFALAWAVIGARQTVRHLGWAVTDDAVLLKSGWLWRRIVVIRFAKIQVVTCSQSPFDRRTRMARVHVDAAGASIGGVVNIPYLPHDEAHALYARLSREAAQRQFAW